MCDDAMTKKGEVRLPKNVSVYWIFVVKLVPRVIKKNVKRKAKACLKHKYYWVHKEEYIISNGMKAVYKILNNQNKVTMKHLYHIRCDPDLDKGFCAM